MKLTNKLMREFAHRINQEVFNNVLDISKLVFRVKATEKQNARAWYYYDDNIGFPVIILIRAEHKTLDQAYASIAHELIHYWQDSVANMGKLCHNGQTFRYWKYRICKMYGLKFYKYF